MTKASDNIFPKVTFVEGSAPASPSASDFHLYFDSSDHALKWKNSAGSVTTVATGASGGAGNGLIVFEPLWSDPVATTGTWTSILFSDIGTPLVNAPAFYNSSTAQNDALSWDMWLDAGTYTFSAWVRKTSNTAIITLNQDGASQGTIDTYAASPALALVSITGWTVSSSGKHTMQVKAATKNASSSGYLLEFFSVIFRRTA